MPWYSAQDSLDALLTGRQIGLFHLVCYLRDGDRVFETYWTTRRGAEAMDYSYALMDLTVHGRQEPWEDSPPVSRPGPVLPALPAPKLKSRPRYQVSPGQRSDSSGRSGFLIFMAASRQQKPGVLPGHGRQDTHISIEAMAGGWQAWSRGAPTVRYAGSRLGSSARGSRCSRPSPEGSRWTAVPGVKLRDTGGDHRSGTGGSQDG